MLSCNQNVHPSWFTNSVYQSPCARQLPLGATTTLPGHQDPLTKSDKTHCHVKCLKSVFSFWVVLIGTVIASVGAGDLDKFAGFVGYFAWYVYSCSFRFPDVSTECADKFVGFVAYALSTRPRCTTRRVRTRDSRRRFFSAWSLLLVPLFRHSQVRKLTFVDVLLPYFSVLQSTLAPSPVERSPYRNYRATFKRASHALTFTYLLPIPHCTCRNPRPDTDSGWPLPPFTNPNLSFHPSFLQPLRLFRSPFQTLKTSALAMQHRYRRPVPLLPLPMYEFDFISAEASGNSLPRALVSGN